MPTMLCRYAKRVHPHTLRHTFITALLRDAGNVGRVREALGHANLAATQIYVHLVDVDLEAALRSFRRQEAVAA